jgi:hypothetical protein
MPMIRSAMPRRPQPLAVVAFSFVVASAAFLAAVMPAATVSAQAQEQTPAQLWDDFNHYVLIARPELAAAAASALLDRVDADALLDIVEASRFRDYEQTLLRASRIETVKDAAERLDATIRAARLGRMRDPQRIRAAIERLGEGRRPRLNAVAELRQAGQFAAPHLLEALVDPQRRNLRPYLTTAIVEIGQPLVYPLSEALLNLSAADQAAVAQMLAEIGYPRAMPYLKHVIENPATDPSARTAAQAAFERIATANALSPTAAAADLYLALAANFYDRVAQGRSLPGFDDATGQGIVWQHEPDTGLVQIDLPRSIFGDVLAMRAARRTLALEPGSTRALSLWLAANQRRANNVPDADYADPTYHEPHPPAFYLKMSGPARQSDVLSLALRDGDPRLARDAIAALDKTAGTSALVGDPQTMAPLIESLSAADRRVRYEAAFAVAKARPHTTFAGSIRVVPVLAEAVRQTHVRHAVVVADNEQRLNVLTAAARAMGHQPIAGMSLAGVADEVHAVSGIDLILIALPPLEIEQAYYEARQNYKMSASPLAAVVDPSGQPTLHAAIGNRTGVFITAVSDDPQVLISAVEPLLADYAGRPIEAEEAERYALTALELLREVAMIRGQVYRISDAEPALLLAMRDSRPRVVVAAARVLAMIDNDRAQRALAELSLESDTALDVRLAVMGSLAESAEYYGNRLTPSQISRLLDLVMTSEPGDLSLVAARVHGALNLPPDNVVRLLNR